MILWKLVVVVMGMTFSVQFSSERACRARITDAWNQLRANHAEQGATVACVRGE